MEIIKDRINDEMKVFSNLIKTLNSYNIKYKIKGNILLHFIQYSKDYNDYFRGTRDLDLDTEHYQLEEVAEAFSKLSPMCEVIHSKDNIIKRIANFNLQNIKHIDINSSEEVLLDEKYTNLYNINGNSFYGNSIEGIFKDKIESISTRLVSRRFKDIIDIYILSKMLLMNKNELIEKFKKYNVGNFEYYFDINTKKAKDSFEGYLSDYETVNEIYEYIGEVVKEAQDNISSGGLLWQ